MLAKPLMPKCWWSWVIVDAKYVGEGPYAEGFDECDVGVDTKDVSEAPYAKILAKACCRSCQRYWCIHVVGDDVRDVGEALTYWRWRLVIVIEDDVEAPNIKVLAWVSRCSHWSVCKTPPVEAFARDDVWGAHEICGLNLPQEEVQIVVRVVSCGIKPHKGSTCK